MKKLLIFLLCTLFTYAVGKSQTVTKDSSAVVDSGTAYYQVTYREYSDGTFNNSSKLLGTREDAESLYFNQITAQAGIYAQNAVIILAQRSLITELLRFGATFPGDLGVDVMSAIWATEADLTAATTWLLRKNTTDRPVTFSISGADLFWQEDSEGVNRVAGFIGSVFFLSGCDGYSRYFYKVATDTYQTADGEYSIRKVGLTAPKSAVLIEEKQSGQTELLPDGTVRIGGKIYKYTKKRGQKAKTWEQQK